MYDQFKTRSVRTKTAYRFSDLGLCSAYRGSVTKCQGGPTNTVTRFVHPGDKVGVHVAWSDYDRLSADDVLCNVRDVFFVDPALFTGGRTQFGTVGQRFNGDGSCLVTYHLSLTAV